MRLSAVHGLPSVILISAMSRWQELAAEYAILAEPMGRIDVRWRECKLIEEIRRWRWPAVDRSGAQRLDGEAGDVPADRQRGGGRRGPGGGAGGGAFWVG